MVGGETQLRTAITCSIRDDERTQFSLGAVPTGRSEHVDHTELLDHPTSVSTDDWYQILVQGAVAGSDDISSVGNRLKTTFGDHR